MPPPPAVGFVCRVASLRAHAADSACVIEFEREVGGRVDLASSTDSTRVLFSFGLGTEWASDTSNGTTVVLHGQVWFRKRDRRSLKSVDLLNEFQSNELDSVAEQLDGSYSIVVVSRGDVTVITDRLSSRKVFLGGDSDGWWLTTSLRQQPYRNIDPAGITSLLINRFTYNGRTIFKNVRSLDRASVHRLTLRGVLSREYWRYELGCANAGNFKASLRDRQSELLQHLRDAVSVRTDDQADILISLSGGVDSRGILGLLLESRERYRTIEALSYGGSNDEDVSIAHELCERLGIKFSGFQFVGNLRKAIELNSDLCDGSVFFYAQGISLVQHLAAQLKVADALFVGDECFGWHAHELRTFDDVLSKSIGIRSPAVVPAYFSSGNFDGVDIVATLTAENDRLRLRCKDISDLHDCKDFLYLDQRLPHLILPWRQYHVGRYVSVMNPYLDSSILDFMQTVPTEYRLDKRLFRETIGSAFPDIFGVRSAKPGGVSVDFLGPLFLASGPDLFELTNDFASDLDNLLPPELIEYSLISMLRALQLSRGRLPSQMRTFLEKISNKWSGLGLQRSFFKHPSGQRKFAGLMAMAPAQMATVLQLRCFLRRH